MRYRNTWVEAIVTETEKIANNVLQIKIQPLGATVSYTVGAHIDISVLINEVPEIRSYSLIGRYKQGESYTIAVKRLKASKGGSKYMWSLKKGNKIKISQPTNNFELSYTSTDYLLIAGGIGITPLISMAEEISKHKDKEVSMIYVGTNTHEMPFISYLKSLLRDKLMLHFSDKDGIYDVSSIVDYTSPKTQVYLCGPLGFMNAIRKTWEDNGYGLSNLRFETFGASGLFAPQSFKLKVPRFNVELEVPKNQSILKTLADANIDVMYDCKKGECGLCQVDVIDYDGVIDHRDCFFSEEEKGENNKLCVCVSRVANGSITIDTAYRG